MSSLPKSNKIVALWKETFVNSFSGLRVDMLKEPNWESEGTRDNPATQKETCKIEEGHSAHGPNAEKRVGGSRAAFEQRSRHKCPLPLGSDVPQRDGGKGGVGGRVQRRV